MAKKIIEGVDRIFAKLKAREKKAKSVIVQVGYTQNYALHVHERVDIPHKVGQAKYLEQPLREDKGQILKIIADAIKAGLTFLQALTMGGQSIQRKSQKLVPVDTGALKGSAYTSSEEASFGAASRAFVRSSKIKQAAKKKKKK